MRSRWERFAIGDWTDTENPQSLRLSMLFHTYSLIGMIIFCIFTICMGKKGRYDLAMGNLSGAVFTFINVLALRFTKRLDWANFIG